jgi:hypothetical protein
LGEISPIGRFLTLGSFLKVTEVAKIFWVTFSHGKGFGLILTKMGLATFWAII